MAKKRLPGYLLHKASGLARVILDGNTIYLGEYGTLESRKEYDEVINRWLANQTDLKPSMLSISVLCLKYIQHADAYYCKNGKKTTEPNSIRISLRYLLKKYAKTKAADFGPKALKTVRESMIKAGRVRTSINCMIGRIRHMFKWAASEELLDASVWLNLRAVAGLDKGREGVVESDPVTPVDPSRVIAIEPYVSRQIWAMINLQFLSGSRPGEIISMRPCDIDRTGETWEFRPHQHKTEHHDKQRRVYFGPKAQAILAPFLAATAPESFVFSPAQAKAEFQRGRSEARETPMTPSQAKRKPKKNPKRKPGARYTIYSYGQAIRKACEKAFGMPPHLKVINKALPPNEIQALRDEASEWRAEHCWHPNQLRHSRGTDIRREYGLEGSQVVLGHSRADVTQVYAERDQQKARDIMSRIG